MPIELPPSIAGKVRDRNRERLRMEMSIPQGDWLSGLILSQLVSMDIDDPDFRATYLLHKQLTDQLEKIRNKKE